MQMKWVKTAERKQSDYKPKGRELEENQGDARKGILRSVKALA